MIVTKKKHFVSGQIAVRHQFSVRTITTKQKFFSRTLMVNNEKF